MNWLVIENDKVIRPEAIEMIGGTDKRNGSFIGKYGSGLKQAICCALRNKMDVRICSALDVYKFATDPVLMDREIVHRVTMQTNTSSPKVRDWTLDMGKHDWKTNLEHGLTSDWMIFREFLCNAMDEGVCRYQIETKINPELGKTKVYIKLTDNIEEIVNNIHKYIARGLLKSRVPIESNPYGFVYPKLGAKGRIYCCGVFVREIPDNLLYDYDLNHLTLTESRTVDVWGFSYALGSLISHCSSAFLADLLRQISSDPKCFEAGLNEHQLSLHNTDKAKQSFEMAFGHGAFTSPEALTSNTEDCLNRSGRNRVIFKEGWNNALKNSGVDNYISVIGEDVFTGFSFIDDKEVSFRVDSELLRLSFKAFDICKKMFNNDIKHYPKLMFFNWTGNPETICLGKAGTDYVGLNAQMCVNEKLVLGTLIEEFAHYYSGASDCSRELVNCIVNNVAGFILKGK